MEASVVVAENPEARITSNCDNQKLLFKADSQQEEAANSELHKKNRIHVSNTKKPFFFYLNLAKKYIKQYNDVELSALGMAIPTVVIIAENLKQHGLAIEKKLMISSVAPKEAENGRFVLKAKMEIVLTKAETLNTVSIATPLKEDN